MHDLWTESGFGTAAINTDGVLQDDNMLQVHDPQIENGFGAAAINVAGVLQEDNMLQAMRLFFDGAALPGRPVPDSLSLLASNGRTPPGDVSQLTSNGHTIPGNLPDGLHPAMNIAPLHTMTNGRPVLADGPRKTVTASLQNLQVMIVQPQFDVERLNDSPGVHKCCQRILVSAS